MLSFPFNSSTVVFYINKDAFKKAGLDPDKAPKTWKEFIAAAREAQGRRAGVRLHDRLAVLDAHRELQRLAQRADRHQGERHGRHRHRVQDQFAAARAAHRDAGRHGEEGPVHLRRPHQPGRGQVLRAASARCSPSSTGAQANIRQNGQVRLVGELHSLPRRREGRAAELDHRRRVAVGDGRQEANDDYKGVAKFFAFLSKPEIQMDWHTGTGYVPITHGGLRADPQVGLLRQEPGRRHRRSSSSPTSRRRPTPRACASATSCRAAR